MKSLWRVLIVAVAVPGALVAGPAAAQSGHDLFQQALTQERAYGNLEQAIQLYEQILSDFAEDRALVANALVQLGNTYEKLGRPDARAAYRRVVDEFADQSQPLAAARQGLAALSARGSRLGSSPRTELTYAFVLGGVAVGDPSFAAPYDVSPDGRQLVFRDHRHAERPAGLYLSNKDGSGVRPLITLETESGPVEGLWTPRWSPAGRRIAFMARFPEGDQGMGLYVLDLDDGAVNRIGDSFGGDLCWTLDGLGITHVGDQDGRLYTSAVDGSGTVAILGDPLPRNTLLGGYSPDGTWLALDIRTQRLGRQMRDLWVLRADGSERFHVTDFQGLEANPTWGSDGSLYFVSDRTGTANLWKLGLEEITSRRQPPARLGPDNRPGRSGGARRTDRDRRRVGNPEQVTFFTDSRVTHPRVIASGGGIAFVLQRVENTIRVADAARPSESWTIGRGRHPQPSPDGSRIFFEGEEVGEGVLVVPRNGVTSAVLIPGAIPGLAGFPRFQLAPDGSAVAYADRTAGGPAIFVVPGTGGARRQLASVPRTELPFPVWSPEADRIAFTSGRGLYVVSRNGGQPTRLAELGDWDAWSIRWSPDGRNLAALGRDGSDGRGEAENHIFVVPASGGAPRRLTPDDEGQYKGGLDWHPDGEQLTYTYYTSDGGVDGLRTAYLDGRPTEPFLDESTTRDYGGVWAPDGSAFYFVASDGDRPGLQLKRLDSRTGAISEVIAGDDVGLPTWSRDGQTMAWRVETVVSQLWLMEDEGS